MRPSPAGNIQCLPLQSRPQLQQLTDKSDVYGLGLCMAQLLVDEDDPKV